MGLIRKAILVGAIIFAMPSPPPSTDQADGAPAASAPSSFAYLAAAADAMADFKGFCERKPQVCTTAQYFASSFAGKAKFSAKLIYEWANQSTEGKQLIAGVAAADSIKTGSIIKQLKGTIAENAPKRIEDLLPELHGTLKPSKG